MKAAFLVLSTALGVAEGKNALETLFTYNCEGQVHMLPDGIGGGAVDMSVIERMWGTYMGRVKERVRCQCPFVSNKVLNERFGLFHNVVENILNPNYQMTPDSCLDNINDPTMDITKFIKKLNIPVQFDVSGVRTCPSPSLQTEDGRCMFQIEIPKMDTSIQVALLRCDSGRPAFSLHCGGKYCDTFKPCNTASTTQECSGSCIGIGAFLEEFELVNEVSSAIGYFGLSLDSCGQTVSGFLENVFRRITGNNAANGFCAPEPTQLNILAKTMENDAEKYMKTETLPHPCGTESFDVIRKTTWLSVDSWDGLLSDGEDAIYNLEFSPYPKVSALPLGNLGATFNCKDELLIPYFGLRVDVSPSLQAVTAELEELWKCQGLNTLFYSYNEMPWNPGFWTAVFTDFQDSVYQTNLCTAAAKLLGAPSTVCESNSLIPGHVVAPTATMGYLAWSMKKAMSLVFDVSQILDFDMKFKVWTEECRTHPLGLPAVSFALEGDLVKYALTMQNKCSLDSECPKGSKCVSVNPELIPSDVTATGLWDLFDQKGCMTQSFSSEMSQHKCASKREFLRDLLIIDPFSSEKKREVLDLFNTNGYKVCLAQFGDLQPKIDNPITQTPSGMSLVGLSALFEPNPFRNE
eukprot:TRINITY_DN54_c0_g1_i10.p1 TRINITY_DN54_c0_g1~~TRINITY_DN54_c0_g1_i10.p1  ORF type:complete len:634 (+),score=129.43 TRINITY_DN54_c0_g1_i10:74-1975(+)